MKKTLYLFLCGSIIAACAFSITAQNKTDKVPAEKVTVKTTDDGIKISEKEVMLSYHNAIMGHWSLNGFLSDGIPPRNFMGGKSFPRGTIFTFARDGKGMSTYMGKTISNFHWSINGDKLKLKYIIPATKDSKATTEKERFTVLELDSTHLVIGTAWEQEMVGRLREQREVQKMKIDLSTHMILAFQRN